jgi:hypothetical protein
MSIPETFLKEELFAGSVQNVFSVKSAKSAAVSWQ